MVELVLCDDGDIDVVLPLARSQGLGIEMQSFASPVIDNVGDVLAKHRSLLERFTGLRSLHGPFGDLCPGSSDPLIRHVTTYRIGQAINVANRLGVSHLILHHGYVPNTSFPANWITRSVDFWRNVLALLPSAIHVHLENVLDYNPEMLLELVTRVGDPRLGVCLDVGHAHAFSQKPVTEWIETLGDNLTYVHLHDNNGLEDQHLPLGEGNMPLREILSMLKTRAPQAIWAIEADGPKSLAWLQENLLSDRRQI